MKAFLFVLLLLAAAAGGWYYYTIYQPQAAQDQTVADLRNTGTAWMSWLVDQVTQGPAGPHAKRSTGHHLSAHERIANRTNPVHATG